MICVEFSATREVALQIKLGGGFLLAATSADDVALTSHSFLYASQHALMRLLTIADALARATSAIDVAAYMGH